MLERLHIEGLEVCRDYTSVLNVYSSERAKRFFEEGKLQSNPNLFDKIVQFYISQRESTHPVLLPGHGIIERNELYGVNGGNLPDRVLFSILASVLDDFSSKDLEVRTAQKNIKFATYPGQTGIDFHLEIPPIKALELTKRLRDYLPEALLKGVTPYVRVPQTPTH